MKGLRAFTATVLCILIPSPPVFSQTGAQDSEVVVMPGGATVLRWHGHGGRTYFIQGSDPNDHLKNWIWSPYIEYGNGEPISHEVGSTADKAFFRLHHTDAPPPTGVTLEQWDADGDGLANALELDIQTHPLNPDTSADGIPDGWAYAHGLNPAANNAAGLFQGGPATNLVAYQQGVQANPLATLIDKDGDGVDNELDADPRDGDVDWEPALVRGYALIEIDVPEEAGQVRDFNDAGHVLFDGGIWDAGAWTTLDQVVVDGGFYLEPYDFTYSSTGNSGWKLSPTGDILEWGRFNVSGPGDSEDIKHILRRGLQEGNPAYQSALSTLNTLDWYGLSGYAFLSLQVLGEDSQGRIFSFKKFENALPEDSEPEIWMLDSNLVQTGDRQIPAGYELFLHGNQVTPSGWLAVNAIPQNGTAPPARTVVWNPTGQEIPTSGGLPWFFTGFTELPHDKPVLSCRHHGSNGLVYLLNENGDAFEIADKLGGKGIHTFAGDGTAMTSDGKMWINGNLIPLRDLCPAYGDLIDEGWAFQIHKANSHGSYVIEAHNSSGSRPYMLVPYALGLVEMDDGGNLLGQPTSFAEPNLSAPSFALNTPTIGAITYGENGISAPLALSGQVRSDGCDAVRGDLGVIDGVVVKASDIGGDDVDEITLGTNVQKATTRTQAGPFAFPFQGDFTMPATPVSLYDGTNLVEVEATDPVSGQLGRVAFAFDVRPVMPEDNLPTLASGGISLSIVIPQDSQSSGEASVEVHVDGEAPVEWQLEESSPGSGLFQNHDESVAIELVDGGNGVNTALFRNDGWNVADFGIPLQAVEGGYQGGFAAITPQVAPGVDPPDYGQILVTEPRIVAESGGGDARAYGLRLTSLDFLSDEQLEELKIFWSGDSGVEYGFIRDAATGAILVADPEDDDQPLVVLPRFAEENLDPEPNAPTHTERLEKFVGGRGEFLQFSAGLIYGFGQGGYDLVVGTGQLLVGAVTYAGDEFSQGLNYFELGIAELFGDSQEKARVRIQIELAQADLEQRRQTIADIAIALNEIRLWIDEGSHDLLASLVLRPFNAEAADFHGNRLGEKAQFVMDVAATLAESAKQTWQNAPIYDKGRYTGLLIFEVASSFVAVTKIGKLNKADVLTHIANRNVDMPGWGSIQSRANSVIADLAVPGACFVPGTPVLVQVNGSETLLPIEQLEPLAAAGVQLNAWAKCGKTMTEDWKPIVRFFTTHPEELFDLAIDTNGDGVADETLTGTGEHPFWVEDASAFVPMREIAPGMRLVRLGTQGGATVTTNISKRGPPGERFTTHNFEVEDFHTYFVGKAGIWVHNNCAAQQADLFESLGRHARGFGEDGHRNLETKRFPAMKNQREQQFAHSHVAGKYWSRYAAENSKMMLADYRNGKFASVDEFPTVREWNIEYFKSTSSTEIIPRAGDANVDVHHSVEKYIQEKLQIPAQFRDECPGIPMLRKQIDADDVGPFHGGEAAEGGLAATMRTNENIPTNMPDATTADRQVIVNNLRRVYEDRGLGTDDYWPVARDWLKKLQQQGHVDSGLIIPE